MRGRFLGRSEADHDADQVAAGVGSMSGRLGGGLCYAVGPRKRWLLALAHPHRAEDRHALVAAARSVYSGPTPRARDGQYGLHQPGLTRDPPCPHSVHLSSPLHRRILLETEWTVRRIESNHAAVDPSVSGDRPNPQGNPLGIRPAARGPHSTPHRHERARAAACQCVGDCGVPAALAPTGMSVSYPKERPDEHASWLRTRLTATDAACRGALLCGVRQRRSRTEVAMMGDDESEERGAAEIHEAQDRAPTRGAQLLSVALPLRLERRLSGKGSAAGRRG
jgi:hypothetical protein